MFAALTLTLTLAPAGPLTGTAAAQPLPAPPQVIDGPSANILSLGGMAVARDGTGGLVYEEKVGGVARVFVSALQNGSFQAPVQLDGGFAGASDQPVIAAANKGVLLVAFVNGGELYAVDRAGQDAPWQPAQPIYGAASNPQIQMSANDNKAYLAFTAAENGGSDVRAAYYAAGTWALAGGPLNVQTGDDAGTGAGRPAVAAAGDGIGIVAWGEGGHVYARRVWGTSPSTADSQVDPSSIDGAGESSSGYPAVSVGGDSSYVDVAFDEAVHNGAAVQSRVLVSRLIAESAHAAVAADCNSSPGPIGADQPQIALNEYGRGFLTSAQLPTNELFAETLTTNGNPSGLVRVDSLVNSAAPYAAPGVAGLTSTVIAWQENPGLGSAEIRFRYAQDGTTLGPEEVLSSPAQGPADAALGLFSGGDGEGDAAAAWVQGAAGARSIVSAQLFVPPGSPAPSAKLQYVRIGRPTLSWSAAREGWGPLQYTVTVDGAQAGQTQSTSLTIATALTDGPHTWQVSATNLGGQTSAGSSATVWVDTTPPRLRLALTGPAVVGRALTTSVSVLDAPPPQAGARGSGVAGVTVQWGDRTTTTGRSGGRHAYRRSGLYRIRATVLDKAGNPTTIARWVRVLP